MMNCLASVRWKNLGILLLLALTTLAARYAFSVHFGLYEDDYTRIPRALGMSAAELGQAVMSAFTTFSDHGKPLHPSLINTLAFVAGKLDGLGAAYVLGYLLFTLNTCLFFTLLARLAPPPLALFGSLAYALFSADTSQALLTHALGLQPSLTFLLCAAHCYLSGRKPLAYVLALLILINYETPFLVFLAVPLLQRDWNKTLFKELVRHTLIIMGLLVGVALVRLVWGEGRVAELSFLDLLTVPLSHMLIGPLVALGTYLYRPLQALQGVTLLRGLAMLLAFGLFGWIFARLPRPVLAWEEAEPRRRVISADLRRLYQLGLAGLYMLVLAYPLTFTVRAYAISGRDTRVHFAAVLGAALLIGCACTLLLAVADRWRWSWLARSALALLFALLVGYGLVVQEDYVAAWEAQKTFWSHVLPLAPDLQDGTVILVEPEGVPRSRQIGANTWTTPRLLQEIYQFPADWQRPPRAYLLEPGWQSYLVAENGKFRLDRIHILHRFL